MEDSIKFLQTFPIKFNQCSKNQFHLTISKLKKYFQSEKQIPSNLYKGTGIKEISFFLNLSTLYASGCLIYPKFELTVMSELIMDNCS